MNTREGGLAAVRAAATSSVSAAAITAGAAKPPGAGAAAAEAPATEVPAAADAKPAASAADPATDFSAQSERARISAIINAPEAKGRENLAQHLAFNTDLAPAAAIDMLKAAPVATAPERTSRLDGKVPAPKVDAIEGENADRDRSAGLHAAVVRQLGKRGLKPKDASAH